MVKTILTLWRINSESKSVFAIPMTDKNNPVTIRDGVIAYLLLK